MKKITLTIALLYTGLMITFAALSVSEAGRLMANLPNAAPGLLSWVALIVACKSSKNGGFLYIALAVTSVFFFNTYQELAPFLMVTLPLLIIGGLFLRTGLCKVSQETGEVSGVSGE